eukprot:6187364-Pleurochrysis_carterae.AAC.1
MTQRVVGASNGWRGRARLQAPCKVAPGRVRRPDRRFERDKLVALAPACRVRIGRPVRAKSLE